MNHLTAAATAAILLISPAAHAAVDSYMKIEGIKGESSVSVEAEGSVKTGTGGATKGKVEATWKVEEGTARTTGGGAEAEVGGTQDINIGVGELLDVGVDGADVSATATVRGDVSVKASDVRALSDGEKQAFIGFVRARAHVRSEEQLESFAKGVILENDMIEEVSFELDSVEVTHQAHGRLFGIFPITFMQEIEVETDGNEAGEVNVEGPWYSFLVTGKVAVAAAIEQELAAKFRDRSALASMNAQAEVALTVSAVIAAKHDTAKNSINNIR